MINLYIFLVLLLIGYVSGRTLENKHFRSIEERENKLKALITINGKRPLGELNSISEARLVCANVVISVDYFKRIFAALRTLFGGNIRAYESLLDRARREAILRLKESCPGATQIINLRIETSSISQGHAKQIGSVEVLAYATAIYT